ncbi:ferredoxin-fold anticodon-binding domain-containing protein 1 [Gastrophryne carolinensis]
MRNILLVGEGNFSYSASLSSCNQGKDLIVATCYETEDAISKHPISSANVEFLRSKGALVYFDVDATRLQDYAFLKDRLYDRIIFNFPHCGRKAGVKKNRDLLCRFFHSCVEVLSPDGEIHVALCQGQGGTPADHPRREWHNSWQIVSMAAKAAFILSNVVPFSSDQYNGYQSTGYRSQEKSFHVDGSLNHIFTRSLPQENLPAIQLIERLADTSSIQDHNFTSRQACRLLTSRESYHPTSLLYKELIQDFQNYLPVNLLPDTFPLICDASFRSSALPSKFSNNVTDQVKPTYVQERIIYSTQHTLAKDPSSAYYTDNISGPNYLTPSLDYFIRDIALRASINPDTLNVLSGPIIRRCSISPWLMPVYHELLILLFCSSDTVTSSLQFLMEIIQNAVDSIAKSISGDVKNELGCANVPFKFSNLNFHQHMDFNYVINLPSADGDKMFGTMKVVPPGESSSDFSSILTALNLDLMTMCLLGIEDWRLLWTPDQRFIQQFHQSKLKPFKNFSLYPPNYTHDISFWVDDGLEFDGIELHAIAQRVSMGNITSIELLEQYEDVKMGKTSLCYRITYQSCDRALSYETALEMQLKLRNELQKCLRITMR